MKNLKDNPNRSHVIQFNKQAVTCFGHSDESIVELVNRYYEGKYNLNCNIINKEGKIIYKSC